MKYIIRLIIVAFGFTAVCFGQADTLAKTKNVNLLSKRGVYILPEKGEIAIGIDAYPLFYYLGGLFSNSGATPPSFNFDNDGVTGIYAKYMLESDLALRLHFQFDFSTRQDIYTVNKSTLAYDPLRPEFVDDIVEIQSNIVIIGLGLEKHRGKGRVQGIYGAEAFFGFTRGLTTYEYGNDITNEFNMPTTYNNSYNNGERIIEDDYDKGYSVGARGFLGVEYFIAPKIALSGEFRYSFFYSWNQNRTQIYEYWNGTMSKTSNVVRESSLYGDKQINVGIDNLDGSISLLFYF